MDATESGNNIKMEHNIRNGSSKADGMKRSSATLNNFSVERILSENTQSLNHSPHDISNKNFVDRKRRLLDNDTNRKEMLGDSVQDVDGIKHPRLSSLLASLNNASIVSQGNKKIVIRYIICFFK